MSKLTGKVAVVTGASKSAQARRRNDLFAVDIWVQGTDGWKALIHHNNVPARPATLAVHPEPAARPSEAAPPDYMAGAPGVSPFAAMESDAAVEDVEESTEPPANS